MRSPPVASRPPAPSRGASLGIAFRPSLAILALALFAACSGGQGCSGGGCLGLAPIKGGFPVDKRKENAIELRLTSGAFSFLSQNAGKLLDLFLPGGEIAVPSSCTGDTQICCGQMCKVKAESSTMAFTPQPPNTTKAVVRTRLRTLQDMNVKVKTKVLGVDVTLSCRLAYDSARRGKPDVGITAALTATVNAQTRLTSLDVPDNSIDILDLEDGDLEIKGDFGCDVANLLKGLFLNTLKDQLKKQLAGPLDNAFCQSCMTKDDCSSLANQGCSAQKRCMRDNVCMQLLGAEGTLNLGGLLPGAKNAALDIYAAAGGYAAVENGAGGLSLGMLGGVESRVKSACVPERAAPQAQIPPKAAGFSGNATPNGKAYHLGAGISTLELNLLGHGLYQSGGLCLSLGTPQVALLSASTLTALVRSLEDLTRGENASIYLVMKPQQAPTFTLGKGTYKTDDKGQKVIDDPLLKIGVRDFAIDFYLYLDDRYTRFMRLTADLEVPLGLDVNDKRQLLPILGDLGQGLKNIRVSDSALLKESPAALSALFPKLLPVLLGQLSTSLNPISLPQVMGFDLKPVQITSVEGQPGKLDFLGLFFELGIGSGMLWSPNASQIEAVDTVADLVSLEVPPASRFAIGPLHDEKRGPRAVLRVDARGSGSLEWQYSVDGGLWRPFNDRHELIVDAPELGLPGAHYIDVRARVAGEPFTLDPTPARVNFIVSPGQDEGEGQGGEVIPSFHGRTGEMGSGCSACTVARPVSGGAEGPWTALFFLGLGAVLLRRRRLVGKRAAAAALALGAVAAGTSACTSTPEGPPAGPKDFYNPDDEVGRYQSAAARGGKIFISAYNSTFGDLAFAEVKDPAEKLLWQVVDGLPEGPPSDTTPNAPRLGQTDPGPDVGRYTSLAVTSNGVPIIAYQDVTNGAVKLAIGPARAWKISTVAAPPAGAKLGFFLSLSLDEADVPTVSYMATGLKRDGGKIASQLVLAQAQTKEPGGPDAWTSKVIEEVEVPCAGFCSKAEACVAVGMAKDPQPSVCKPIETTCTPSCGSGKACVAKACVDVLAPLPAHIPEGTGLYSRIVRGAGQMHVVFHNRITGALKVASAPEFMPKAIDGGDGKVDVGQHLGAAMSSDGTLHVAYVDAVADRLLFRSVKGGMSSPIEVVDDGIRGSGAMREQHAVGAGALVFLDGDAPRIAYQNQTAGTLELAARGTGWTHETKGPGGTRSRGYYPQAVQVEGKWYLLDVTYDRMREFPLSAVEFSPL
jgi:hypothetical protein